MGIKTFIKEHCPESLLPLVRSPYRIAAAPYRKIKHSMKARMISERAMKYLSYYQDELSREVLRDRLKYIKTGDRTIFLDMAEKCGIKYEELNGCQAGNFSGIVIVYDDETSNDFRYVQRFMHSGKWAEMYRMMKLKDFLKGAEIKTDELVSYILTGYNAKKFNNYLIRNNLLYKLKGGPLSSTGNEEQYLDVFSPVDDEIMIDAGAYDGMTALRFLKWGGSKIKRIYSFELDPVNIPKCEENLKGHEDKVTLINKGTWSKNESVYISSEETSSHVSENGTTEAGLAMIDDIVKDEKVTFIKMDVEGAELESLKGAKNTIIKNHPRLAICAYHKNSDLYELPEYILSLVPEYRFYLRHYCSREWETVLYASVN